MGYLFSIEGTCIYKGYLFTFSAKMVCKKVRGWTSGQRLPILNFVKYPLQARSNFDSPMDRMFVHRTHLYTQVEKGSMRVMKMFL